MSSDRSTQTRGLSRRDVLRRGAAATAVAGLGLSGLTGSAAAGGSGGNGVPSDAIPIDGPTTITEPGYYVLTKNIKGTIDIPPGSRDITIDGQGYCIEGTGKDAEPVTYGIRAGEYIEDNTENITVKNVIIKDFSQGIRFGDLFGGEIHNVIVKNCGSAIEFWNANSVTISDSILKKNVDAIFTTEGGDDNTFVRNRITRNGDAGSFTDAEDGLVFKNNYVDYNEWGLSITEVPRDATFKDNLFFQNGGSPRGSYGLFIVDLFGGVVRGNRFIENKGPGLYLLGSSGVVVEENDIFRNTGRGIDAIDISSYTVSKNRIIGNSDDGVHLYVSDENEIVGNLIRQNGGDGIELSGTDDDFNPNVGSTKNVIRENIIRENGDLPIRIGEYSTGNVVEDNRINDDAPNVCQLPEE